MNPLIRSFRFWLLTIAVILSGLTVEANTGRGFILLVLPIVGLLVINHLVSHMQYRRNWLIGTSGFTILCLTNGSRSGSLILILMGLILFESLQDQFHNHNLTNSDKKTLFWGLVIFAVVAAIDLITSRVANMWTTYADYETRIVDLPRLKLFFSEPSYLGVFAVAIYFKLNGDKRLQKIIFIYTLITQSVYAFVYFLIMFLRRYAFAVMLTLITTISLIALFAREEPYIFFLNSGLVRLVGITLLENMNGISLLIGHGLGAGDLSLIELFSDFGIEKMPNGFLFSLFHDVGILGMVFLYLAYSRSIFDFLLFNILLLNFGIGSFLLPILMFMGSSKNNKDLYEKYN